MGYRFRHDEGRAEQGVRRIAREEIDAAIASIDKGGDPAIAVHDVRLCCKKLRALVRLVAPAFPDHAEVDAGFRNLARRLSAARDAKVAADTLDVLARDCSLPHEADAIEQVRHLFAAPRGERAQQDCWAAILARSRLDLAEARVAAAGWSLDAKGWDALGKGTARTMRKARRFAGRAADGGDAADYHDLRKALKYHMYHTRLLRGLWPEVMTARARTIDKAAQLLGQHHDLFVLEAQLGQWRDLPGTAQVLDLAARHREAIEARAWPLVRRIVAQKPKDLADSWGALWNAWQAD